MLTQHDAAELKADLRSSATQTTARYSMKS